MLVVRSSRAVLLPIECLNKLGTAVLTILDALLRIDRNRQWSTAVGILVRKRSCYWTQGCSMQFTGCLMVTYRIGVVRFVTTSLWICQEHESAFARHLPPVSQRSGRVTSRPRFSMLRPDGNTSALLCNLRVRPAVSEAHHTPRSFEIAA